MLFENNTKFIIIIYKYTLILCFQDSLIVKHPLYHYMMDELRAKECWGNSLDVGDMTGPERSLVNYFERLLVT